MMRSRRNVAYAQGPPVPARTPGRAAAQAPGAAGGGRRRVTKRTAAKKAPSRHPSVQQDSNARPSVGASGSRRRPPEVIEIGDDESEGVRDAAGDEQSDHEFEVEAIVDHKKGPRGALRYYVKWKDWPETSNTWENAKDVYCDDLIKEYWEKQKTKTLDAQAPSSGRTPARIARSLDRQPVSSRIPGARTLRMMGGNDGLPAASGSSSPTRSADVQEEPLRGRVQGGKRKDKPESARIPYRLPPRDQWEDEAVAVLAVEMDAGGLMAELEWSSGDVTRHSAAELREWAPKKLVDYYQARIHFVQG